MSLTHDHSMILYQHASYIGINFNGILYGVELVLYFMTVRVMLNRERERVPADKYFLLFSTVLLLLSTLFVAIEAVFGEEMWIVNANYPGGMDAYLFHFTSGSNILYQTLVAMSPLFLRSLSDSLLVYRSYVVWDDIRILLLLILVYLASFVLGIVQLYESSMRSSHRSATLMENFGLAYLACTIGLEVVVTSLISARIYFAGKKFSQVLGGEVGRTYTGAAAIMVESMLLSTLTGVAFLVSFAVRSQINTFFSSIWAMMLAIAPQLVVYRVFAGRAWTRHRSAMTSPELEFVGRSPTQISRISTQAVPIS